MIETFRGDYIWQTKIKTELVKDHIGNYPSTQPHNIYLCMFMKNFNLTVQIQSPSLPN